MIKEPPSTVAIEPIRQNWSIGTSRSGSRDLYALAMVDVDWSSGGSIFSLSEAANRFKDSRIDGPVEFVFNVNPKSIEMDEPAAITVLPTQDGGQFVEHQGCVNRTIMISGTTGFRPNRSSDVDLIPVLGIPNPFAGGPVVDPLSGLPVGETSGFEDLINLRNFFRRYFDIKRDIDLSHKIVMVWQNAKEGEFFVVEPMSFRTRRDSSSPLTSTYDIQLRTIEKVEFVSSRTKDDRKASSGLVRMNEILRHASQQMASDFRKIEGVIDSSVSLGQQSISNLLSIADTMIRALANVTLAGSRVFDVPRNSISNFITGCQELINAFQTSAAKYGAYKENGGINASVLFCHSLKTMMQSAITVYTMDALYEESLAQKYAAKKAAYRNSVTGMPRTGGSSTSIVNTAVPAGSKIKTVGSPDTIYSLAQRFLGDQGRWKELVVLNNLRSPYVSPTGDGVSVLRPGDQILVPSASRGARSGVEPDRKSTDLLSKRLGRDLKLVSASAGDPTQIDLRVGTDGDLERIVGVDNMTQAVKLKFATERGELALHPGYGINAPIGRKVNLRSLVGFQLDVRGSLLQDPRISRINKLKFQAEGNIMRMTCDVQIADVDQAALVSFDTAR